MEPKKELKKYEEQKQEIFEIAEKQFGKTYFEKIEEILRKIEEIDEQKIEYSITVNNKGAFYASEN